MRTLARRICFGNRKVKRAIEYSRSLGHRRGPWTLLKGVMSGEGEICGFLAGFRHLKSLLAALGGFGSAIRTLLRARGDGAWDRFAETGKEPKRLGHRGVAIGKCPRFLPERPEKMPGRRSANHLRNIAETVGIVACIAPAGWLNAPRLAVIRFRIRKA